MVSRVLEELQKSRTPEEFVKNCLLERIRNPVTLAGKPLKVSGDVVYSIRFVRAGSEGGPGKDRINLAMTRIKRGARVRKGSRRKYGQPYLSIDWMQVPLSVESWPKKTSQVYRQEHRDSASETLLHPMPLTLNLIEWPSAKVVKDVRGRKVLEVPLSRELFSELKEYSRVARLVARYNQGVRYAQEKIGLGPETALKRLLARCRFDPEISENEAIERLKRTTAKHEAVIKRLDNARTKEEITRALQGIGKMPSGLFELLATQIADMRRHNEARFNDLFKP